MKIYDDDPEVYARTSSIKADRTKAEIDGVLAKYGIRDVWWHFNLADNDVWVKFILPSQRGARRGS